VTDQTKATAEKRRQPPMGDGEHLAIRVNTLVLRIKAITRALDAEKIPDARDASAEALNLAIELANAAFVDRAYRSRHAPNIQQTEDPS
jgi:hypothetical protein